jgi:hypothetical protein
VKLSEPPHIDLRTWSSSSLSMFVFVTLVDSCRRRLVIAHGLPTHVEMSHNSCGDVSGSLYRPSKRDFLVKN